MLTKELRKIFTFYAARCVAKRYGLCDMDCPELLGSRGGFNRNLIRNKFKCNDAAAREACDVLNAKMRAAKKSRAAEE